MQDNRGENLILASSLKNILSNRTISGLGEGEKIMLSAQYDRLIFCQAILLALVRSNEDLRD